LHKPDLTPGRHAEEADPDREALEHIARALESRRFQRQADGESRAESEEASELFLAPKSVKALLEDMPIAAAILAGGALVHANSAFANAFGYPSAAELIEAGGLGAILGDGKVRMQGGSEPVWQVEALTRSRRRVKVAFASSVLDAGRKVQLVRLIDPPVPEGAAAPPQASPAQTPPKPEPAPKPEPGPRPQADAAGSRLDFLAKVSHGFARRSTPSSASPS
jgi:PAS domain-containing protein